MSEPKRKSFAKRVKRSPKYLLHLAYDGQPVGRKTALAIGRELNKPLDKLWPELFGVGK